MVTSGFLSFICGVQCVTVVLVSSHAWIGPKPEEVRADARRRIEKDIVRVLLT